VYVSRGTAEVDEEAWVRSIVGPAGAVLLDNERMWVRVGEVGLTLVGIVAAGPLEEHRQKLLELIAGAGESRPPMTGEDGSPEPRRDSGPIILLYHDPDLAEAAAKAGIGLYLAGHTHGGQVRLPLIGPLFTNSRYGRRFAAGRFGLGAMTLIVSRGIGLEGAGAPRLRFLCPPEVVAITVTL
jgi:predicted MPP superfamily phosphohydrolase